MPDHRVHRLLAILFLAAPWLACAEPVLRLASDDWCPYICAADGKIKDGYLVDVVAGAMALTGYKVEPVLRPLNRAIHETVEGDMDGVYAPPLDQRLLQSAPIAYSRACFYTRAGDRWTYQGLASLQQHTLGVIEDYGYDGGALDAYIAQHHHQPSLIELAYGDNAGLSNLQKLLNGRYQILLEHQAVLARLSQQLHVAPQLRQAGCLEQALPLNVGFARQDRRGEAWIRALAEGLRQLESSGQLKALRLRYQIAPTTP